MSDYRHAAKANPSERETSLGGISKMPSHGTERDFDEWSPARKYVETPKWPMEQKMHYNHKGKIMGWDREWAVAAAE